MLPSRPMPADPSSPKPVEAVSTNGFASTEWSLVLAASAEGGPALDRLCRAYWQPLYIYVRAAGLSPSEAEDATQEFFTEMLRRDWLKLADRERGRFRGFLCSSVRQFLGNRRRVANADKRGGGAAPIPLDAQECEREFARKSHAGADPATLFDESWADCVLRASIERLSSEQSRAPGGGDFERLRPFLMCPPGPGDYARLGDELGVPSAKIAVRVHRLTQRLGDLIRAEVAATLVDRSELEAELRYLLRLVSQKV